MMKFFTSKPFVLAALFFLSQLLSFAQVASFTVNESAGCSPHSVAFTNTSTGATSYYWSFGNNNISTLPNPSELFTTPGQYTVTLTAKKGNVSNSTSQVITVYKNPQANFTSTKTSFCRPFNANLLDASIKGDGNITNWEWGFGDGTKSYVQNPSHIFETKGVYVISLQITDEYECYANITKEDFIMVTDPPVVNFDTKNLTACEPPLNVTYSNTSTGTGSLKYSWDFGDGQTSTVKNPSTTYNGVQSYNVSLTVTDVNGCATPLNKPNYIQVTDVIADFNIPDTVCHNVNYQYTNTTIGGISYSWNFGDGSSSTQTSPSHSYATAGLKTITLTATGLFGCTDVKTKNVFVEQVTADYSYTPNYWCQSPKEVKFTNLSSSNASVYQWTYGDDAISTSATQINHVYDSAGVFTTSLYVETSNGCNATISKGTVRIAPFVVTVAADTNRACLPLPVDFTETNTSEQKIVNWLWNFGDGSTSTDSLPNHVFNMDGDFTVNLEITNEIGCKSFTKMIVEVGKVLEPKYKIDSLISCAVDPVAFKDISADSLLIDKWWWDFGEGEGSNREEFHLYADTTGKFPIQFAIYYNGCSSDTIKKDTVLIYGPIIKKEKKEMDCKYPYTYNFTFSLVDATRYNIDYGDGFKDSLIFPKITSTLIQHTHTYADSLRPKDFSVKINAFNDSVPMNEGSGCDFEKTLTVLLREIIADFSISDTTPCANEVVTFTDESQDGNSYVWEALNKTTSEKFNFEPTKISTYTFNTNAIFDITLFAKDVNGCLDTAYSWLKTYRPVAEFTVDSLIGCTPFLANFYDASTSDTLINKWTWSFGDGSTSKLQNSSHNFNQIQNYSVNLVVEDTLHCSNSKTITITSTKPKPAFSISDRELCAGEAVQLSNSTVGYGNLTYNWNFADGTPNDNSENPEHIYNNSGKYEISLFAEDEIGCDSLFTTTDSIDVQAIPIADFTVDTTVWDCYYKQHYFQFSDITNHPNINPNSYLWYFGDGQSSNLQNPTNIYHDPDVYKVTMFLETTFGCKDSILKLDYITVKGPKGTPIVEPIVCRGDNVLFLLKDTSNVYSFDWFFGDGGFILNSSDSVFHAYNTDSYKSPTLILHSDTIETCDVPIQTQVYIHEISAEFTDNSLYCVNENNIQVDGTESSSIDGIIVSWKWDFGNGQTANDSVPIPSSYSYATEGDYKVQLIIENDFGCTDTTSKIITIYPLPTVIDGNDTTVCKYKEAQIWAAGGVSYQWSPLQGIIGSSSIANIVVSPDSTKTYQALVTDVHGCKSTTDGVTVGIIQPLLMDFKVYYNDIEYSSDTLAIMDSLGTPLEIILGDTVYFKSFSDSQVLIDWGPHEVMNCWNCSSTFSSPKDTNSIDIVIFFTDPTGCDFSKSGKLKVDVKPLTLDVPTAFSPNGNSLNRVIYPKGWGIEEIVEFKVFNRWGEMVFESLNNFKTDKNDEFDGWDGTYKGIIQNVDTYVYTVIGKAFNGTTITKNGHINLIK